jgi:hypothetical protein
MRLPHSTERAARSARADLGVPYSCPVREAARVRRAVDGCDDRQRAVAEAVQREQVAVLVVRIGPALRDAVRAVSLRAALGLPHVVVGALDIEEPKPALQDHWGHHRRRGEPGVPAIVL